MLKISFQTTTVPPEWVDYDASKIRVVYNEKGSYVPLSDLIQLLLDVKWKADGREQKRRV